MAELEDFLALDKSNQEDVKQRCLKSSYMMRSVCIQKKIDALARKAFANKDDQVRIEKKAHKLWKSFYDNELEILDELPPEWTTEIIRRRKKITKGRDHYAKRVLADNLRSEGSSDESVGSTDDNHDDNFDHDAEHGDGDGDLDGDRDVGHADFDNDDDFNIPDPRNVGVQTGRTSRSAARPPPAHPDLAPASFPPSEQHDSKTAQFVTSERLVTALGSLGIDTRALVDPNVRHVDPAIAT